VRKRYIVATGFYCAAIWYLSSQPGPGTLELPFVFQGMDKIAHMILYGGLAALVSVGIRRSDRPAKPWVQNFVPILFASLYGVTDEIHQYFVPTREADVADIVANLAGAAIIQGILCYFWWKGKAEKAGEMAS